MISHICANAGAWKGEERKESGLLYSTSMWNDKEVAGSTKRSQVSIELSGRECKGRDRHLKSLEHCSQTIFGMAFAESFSCFC